MDSFEYYYFCLIHAESSVVYECIQSLIDLSFGKSITISDCLNNDVLVSNFQRYISKFKTDEAFKSFIFRERLYYLKITCYSVAKLLASTSCPSYIVNFITKFSNQNNSLIINTLTGFVVSSDFSILEKCECLQCLVILLTGNRDDLASSKNFEFSSSDYFLLNRYFKQIRRLLSENVEHFCCKELHVSLLDLLLSLLRMNNTHIITPITSSSYGGIFCRFVNQQFIENTSLSDFIKDIGKRAVHIADLCVYQVSFIACQLALTLVSDYSNFDDADFQDCYVEIIELVNRLIVYHPVELGTLIVEMKPDKSNVARAIAIAASSNNWHLLNVILHLPANPLSNALLNTATTRLTNTYPLLNYSTMNGLHVMQYDWSLGYYLGLYKWKLLFEHLTKSGLETGDCIQLIAHASSSESGWRLELFSPIVLNYYSNIMCILIRSLCQNMHRSSIDLHWLAYSLQKLILKCHVCLPVAVIECSLKIISDVPGDRQISHIIASVIVEDKLIFDYYLKAISLNLLLNVISVEESLSSSDENLLKSAEQCAINVIHQTRDANVLLPTMKWLLAKHDCIGPDVYMTLVNFLDYYGTEDGCDHNQDNLNIYDYYGNRQNGSDKDINLVICIVSILANCNENYQQKSENQRPTENSTILNKVLKIFRKYISNSVNTKGDDLANDLIMLFSSLRQYIYKHQDSESITILGQLAALAGTSYPRLLSECLDFRMYLLLNKDFLKKDETRDKGVGNEQILDVMIPEYLDCIESALIAIRFKCTNGLRFQFPSKLYSTTPLAFLIIDYQSEILLDNLLSTCSDDHYKCILPKLIDGCLSLSFTDSSILLKFRYILPLIQQLLLTLDDKQYLNYKCILANVLLQSAGTFVLPIINVFLSTILPKLRTFSECLCPLMCTILKLLPFNRLSREHLQLLKMLVCKFNDELLAEQQDKFENLDILIEPLIMLSPTLCRICSDAALCLDEYPLLLKFRDDEQSEFNVISFERCTGLCLIAFRKYGHLNNSLLEKMLSFIICHGIMCLRRQPKVYGFKHFIRAELDRVFTVLSTYIKRKHLDENVDSVKYFESLSILYKFSFQRA
ncbi:hypothetical protein GJ496_005369 [Pomphorhynchus laevis]|nr:hypothetical protein GJ496_005369 [Pomphorhynchus laevis]